MIASVIPFFLVANLTGTETSWPLGPEYFFMSTMTGTYIINLVNETTINARVKMINDISCRPKTVQSLTCESKLRSTSLTLHNSTTIDLTDLEDSSESKQAGNQSTIVDIDFDEKGISSYSAPNDTKSFHLMAVKLMMNDLSIGADLSNKGAKFEELGKTYLGECNTDFTITKSVPSQDSRGDVKYRLMAKIGDETVENVEVKKDVQIQNCKSFKLIMHAFSAFGDFNPSSPIKVERYWSEMNLADDKFVSQSHIKGSLRNEQFDALFSEDYIMELVDISPASKPLEEIKDAETSSVFAFE